VIALLVAGRLADRERDAEAPTTKTWRVISVVVSVLVVLLAIGTVYQTVRTGHSGSEAVWSGIGS
jgi:biotin transporter BioY